MVVFCGVHIHVAFSGLFADGYVEGYCTPDNGHGQIIVCLSSIAWLDLHIFHAIGL